MILKFEQIKYGDRFLGERVDLVGAEVWIFDQVVRDNIQRRIPDASFSFQKQAHGSTVVQVPTDSTFEADGQWTKKPNILLSVYTADCLPVLIYDSRNNWVMALHAGWRGLVQKIIPYGLEKMRQKLPWDANAIQVVIGPHIHKSSFEVHKDVADSLAKCSSARNSVVFDHPSDKNKRLIDLTQIAISQLKEQGVERVLIHSQDTFKTPHLPSYRRDQPNVGRLVSGIRLLPK